jgi:hypothetical protein
MDVQSKINLIKDLFRDEELVQAYELLEEFLNEYSGQSQILNIIDSVPEIQALRQDVADTTQCLNMLADMSSWTLNNESDGISTYISGNGREFLVRSEAEIETGLFPILVLLAEPDMLPKWLPMLSDVKILGEPTKYRRILNYKFNLPWPVSDREASVLGRGMPLIDSRGLVIMLKTVESNYLGTDIPAASEGSVKVDISLSCIYIQYSQENKCSISLIIRSDPKLPLIPQWLINYGTKQVTHIFLKNLREYATKFAGSEFEDRVKARPEFYNDIHKKLEDYQMNYL